MLKAILKNIDNNITSEAAKEVAKIDSKFERMLELEKKNIINKRYIHPFLVILIMAFIAMLIGKYFHFWDLPVA